MSSSQKGIIKLLGTVKTVKKAVLFVDTARGTVFVPLEVAISVEEAIDDLTSVYRAGDVVEVRMIAQEPKNGCAWRGVKVFKKKPTNPSPSKASNQCASTSTASAGEEPLKIVSVTNVNEGMAYAHSPEFGTIFIPGNSFDSKETKQLIGYLKQDDLLEVTLVEQPMTSGCKWKSIKSTKYTSKSDDGLPTGFGFVESVEPFACLARWENSDVEIHCPILTYTGGDFGEDAESLTNIIKKGDQVVFRVRLDRFNRLRATNWHTWKSKERKIKGFEVGNTDLSEAHTQTTTPNEYALLRSLYIEYPDAFSNRPNVLNTLDPKFIEMIRS